MPLFVYLLAFLKSLLLTGFFAYRAMITKSPIEAFFGVIGTALFFLLCIFISLQIACIMDATEGSVIAENARFWLGNEDFCNK